MDLSITPEQYKKLWWKELIAEISKEKKFFTIPDLYKFAQEIPGMNMSYNNFARAAKNFAPMFETGITQELKIGRPATYYCSTDIDRYTVVIPPREIEPHFDNIVAPDEDSARRILETLELFITRYGVASVSDLYDLCGLPSRFPDHKLGWSDLSKAKIFKKHGEYILSLPEPTKDV